MNRTDGTAWPNAPRGRYLRANSSASWWRIGNLARVLLPALALCLINAAKPLTIDDPVYYAYGRHIADHPLDPHGFSFFWYQHPLPAHQILAPPVFSFWLGLGFFMFGDGPLLAKLWLLPWCVLLAIALNALLHRFARPLTTPLLWLTLLSPAVLPLLNLMIDVPCLALHLAAVAVFLAAWDRGSIVGSVFAGVLAGFAMQTKYTALTSPVVIMVAAMTSPASRRRQALVFGIVTAVTAITVFAAWEVFTHWRYGQSHFFLDHLSQNDLSWSKRLNLVGPLVAQWGGVGQAVGLLALVAWRVPGRSVFLAVAWLLMGLAVVAYGAEFGTDGAARVFAFGLPGAATLAVLIATAIQFLRRNGRGPGRAADRFLAAWWLIEMAAAIVISPWPAARRVIVPVVVGTLLIGRLAALRTRTQHRRRLVWVVAACGILLGMFVEAIDIDNAAAEPAAVESTTTWIRGQDATGPIYFTGHWGLQFYAERADWQAVDPDHTHLAAGSWLVVPDRELGCQRIETPADAPLVHRVAVESRWPLATIPWLHAANTPLRRQIGPIVTLRVYRVRADCVPQTPATGGMLGP